MSRLVRLLENLRVRDKKMFTTTKKNTRYKGLMCPMALEYGLNNLPCSTEWIDVHYEGICLNSMMATNAVRMPL